MKYSFFFDLRSLSDTYGLGQAQIHLNRAQWERIVCPDECSIEIGIGCRREWIWRHSGEKWLPDNIGMYPMKGVKLVVWAAFNAESRMEVCLPS